MLWALLSEILVSDICDYVQKISLYGVPIRYITPLGGIIYKVFFY